MKYIDVEKLKAEIERFSATEYGGNTFGDDVANGALDYVLEEIIPSLQQEQLEIDKMESKHTEVWVEGRTIFEQDAKKPVDLEKEIEKKWNECDSIDEGMGAEYANIVIEQFDEICKYFYELGLKAIKEK